MTRQDDLKVHLFQLVNIARNVHLKRALTTADPDPTLNFWRLLYGNQLDISVLEWCKIFGMNSEPCHWKNVVPNKEHGAFRAAMLSALSISASDWDDYWNEMTTYRTRLVAHHFEVPRLVNYPKLDLILKSTYFYYSYLIRELRDLGETDYPDSLADYGEKFEVQAIHIAQTAVSATAAIAEQVF